MNGCRWLWAGLVLAASAGHAAGVDRVATCNVAEATVGGAAQKTPEVSTDELSRILAERRATVVDARPPLEFSISHIPGAVNVDPKIGTPISTHISDVAEIERLVGGNKAASIVLYCNGPHCGKSKRLADSLLAQGFTDVRRYQLGIPFWRALGGVTVIEATGLRHVLPRDRTAVVIDAREIAEFRRGAIAGSRNIPRSGVLDGKDVGEVKRAKDDGRLPVNDHNTRIIVIGRDAGQARYVAQALTREAFHNVSYFPGSFTEARAAVRGKPAASVDRR